MRIPIALLTIAAAIPAGAASNQAAKKTQPQASATSAKKGASAAAKKTAPGSPKSAAFRKSSAASRKNASKGRPARNQPAETWRSRQLAPTPERYNEIQDALIRKGYLQGSPTGRWDAASADALRRFQQDQNLEASGKLNSLSIIALGLGPKYDSTAAVSTPPPARPPQPQN